MDKPIEGQSHWCGGITLKGTPCTQIVRNGRDHCEAGHPNTDHLYVSQFSVEKLKRVVSVE